MSNLKDILIPDIGDFTDVPVVEVSVADGSVISKGDTIVVLESDKATIDVPSDVSGTVIELKVAVDDLVSEGTAVLSVQLSELDETRVEQESVTLSSASPSYVDSNQGTQAEQSRPNSDVSAEQLPAQMVTDTHSQALDNSNSSSSSAVYASPSMRRYARQLGVPLESVIGTGIKNRITKEDIELFVKNALATRYNPTKENTLATSYFTDWPKVDFEKHGPIERIPIGRIGKISGPALTRNAALIPHVTNFDKADITELEAFRKQANAEIVAEGTKLSILAFTIKAAVSALKAFPDFNSSLDAEELIHKHYWNIGIAVNTKDGLVVPVIKDADKKGLVELANDIANFAEAARTNTIRSTDLQGATFTISSLGGIGGTNFTPIINAPEVAILGMTRAEIQPVWDGSNFQPRLIQPMSLSWDHRVVNGVAAAQFLLHVRNILGEFKRLSL